MPSYAEHYEKWAAVILPIMEVIADAYWRERYGPGYACWGMGV